MSYSLLEQTSPAAATEQTLYAVPADKFAKLGSITICNASGAARTFRLAIVKGGGVTSAANYIFYDQPLPFPGTVEWYQAEEVQLDATDVVRIYADSTGVGFTVIGKQELVANSAAADEE